MLTLLLAILSLGQLSSIACEFAADLAPEPGLYRVSVLDAEGQWWRGEFRVEAGRRDYTVVVQPVAVADEGSAWPWAPWQDGREYVEAFWPDERVAWKWWRD